jgi:uracil permease
MSDVSNPEYNFQLKDCLLGAQMLFVAFGALVLVPLLTGLDPSIALFGAGCGTLLFQIITKGQVPIFLASSFAFIAPISFSVAEWGIPATMGGLFIVGIIYVIVSFIIRIFGSHAIKKVLPDVVTGPVIMVIGLVLAPVAVNMATGKNTPEIPYNQALIISMASLATTVAVSQIKKGWMKLVPILFGIIVGYSLSVYFGVVDFTKVHEAAWIAIPNFTAPTFNLKAILYIAPVAIAPMIEHFGDVLAISSVTGKDYLKKPGIQNTMLGDGVAICLASTLGGPPVTTYSEVTGAVALTRVFNPAVMTWTAISAILLAFCGKLGAFLLTIPAPVMGGIMILLFGAIMVIGVNTLVKSGEDMTKSRNMSIIALIVIMGVGGMSFNCGEYCFGGIGLSGVIGVILNLVIPKDKNEENEKVEDKNESTSGLEAPALAE